MHYFSFTQFTCIVVIAKDDYMMIILCLHMPSRFSGMESVRKQYWFTFTFIYILCSFHFSNWSVQMQILNNMSKERKKKPKELEQNQSTKMTTAMTVTMIISQLFQRSTTQSPGKRTRSTIPYAILCSK